MEVYMYEQMFFGVGILYDSQIEQEKQDLNMRFTFQKGQ